MTHCDVLCCLHLAPSGSNSEHQWMMRNPLTQSCFRYRRGLTQDTKLVVGLPMLSSPGNLRFWITLCGCSAQDPDLAALLADFERAAAAGKPQLRNFCREWNADLLRKVPLHVPPRRRWVPSVSLCVCSLPNISFQVLQT
jgi:hypothetical protein